MARFPTFNLWFETDEGTSFYPGHVMTLRPRPSSAPDGWTGSAGPGIDPEAWPHDPRTGVPMAHGITLRLPPNYRRRGDGYPGLSFFQAGSLWRVQSGPASPTEVAHRRAHPMQEIRFDGLGIAAALVWLTEDELSAPPTPLDPRGKPEVEEAWPNGWRYEQTRYLWLEQNEDPNAGRAPRDVGRNETIPDGGYVPSYVSNPNGFIPQVGESHLGGTALHLQGLPEGLSPWYLEIASFENLSLGDGGTAQIDLENPIYDWAGT